MLKDVILYIILHWVSWILLTLLPDTLNLSEFIEVHLNLKLEQIDQGLRMTISSFNLPFQT